MLKKTALLVKVGFPYKNQPTWTILVEKRTTTLTRLDKFLHTVAKFLNLYLILRTLTFPQCDLSLPSHLTFPKVQSSSSLHRGSNDLVYHCYFEVIPSKQPRLSLSSLLQSTIIILIPSTIHRGSNYFSALIRECRVCVSIIRILNSKCVQLLDCHQDHF